MKNEDAGPDSPASEPEATGTAPPTASLIYIEFVDGVPHAHPQIAKVHAGDTIVWYTDADVPEGFDIELMGSEQPLPHAAQVPTGTRMKASSTQGLPSSGSQVFASRSRQIAIFETTQALAQTTTTYAMKGVWPKGEDLPPGNPPPGGGVSLAIIIVKPPRLVSDEE